jgi:transporter family-2 protein
MNPILLAAALLAGCLLAVQASANQQLNKAVGTPFGASTLQLLVAFAALAVSATVTGTIGAVALLPDAPWWQWLGGIASPLYITAGILLFPRLGALAAVGLFVTGQVFASLALDLFGLFAVPQRPVGAVIVLGALAVLAGITIVVRGQRTAAALPSAGGSVAVQVRAPARTGWVVLGLVAGAVLPVQGAINAGLRTHIGAPLAVATISFAVAALAIAALLAVLLLLRRTPAPSAPRPMPWWGWLGGLCAAAYVTATFLLIPTIGAAVTVALTVTGQQVASAVVDIFGWFGMPPRRLTAPRGAGLALLVAGSVLVQLA